MSRENSPRLFAITLAVSAALLFWVELLVARLILPVFGGSPAVWTTCLFFFQGALLLGYGWAHLASRWSARRQCALQIALLGAGALLLPVAIPAGFEPAPDQPLGDLLLLLVTVLFLPFLAISASAPMLQGWYARRSEGADPYPLYAASNAGSLVALLAYPVALEPALSLSTQGAVWSVGYGLLVALTLASGLLAGNAPAPAPATVPAVPRSRQVRWLCSSFVPAGLLYGVTTHLTTVLPPTPLLWAAPLALYLLSFVVAFTWKGLPRNALAVALAIPLAAMLLAAVIPHRFPLGAVLALHLLGFFGAATLLHHDLARQAPPSSRLTTFYLWVAGGGLLGGVFCAAAAPLLFPHILEYPLLLMVALLLLPDDRASGIWPEGSPRWVLRSLLLALGILTPVLLSGFQPGQLLTSFPALLTLAPVLIALALVFPLGRIRAGAALVLAVGIAASVLGPMPLHQERSFFGVHRVVERDGLRHYMNNSVVHGRQHTDPARASEPTSYHHRDAPLGRAIAGAPRQRVAVLGLGIGSLAAYAQPGQRWRFYEIDPAVERIARDEALFTFLRDARAPCQVVLGDARRSLAREAEADEEPWDLLVLDVFSSDSVPIHLLTREAFELYLDRLAPRGLLVANVSTHHLDLIPLFAAAASELGLVGVWRLERELSDEQREAGRSPSQVVVLARSPTDLAHLSEWEDLSAGPRVRLWTDDHAWLLDLLR